MLPFLSGTIACRCVVLPIYLGCHAQHFYSLHSSLSSSSLSSLCPILRLCFFHLLFLHPSSCYFVFSRSFSSSALCLSLSLSPRWSLSLHRHLSCYFNSRRPLEFDLNVSSHPDFYFSFAFSVGLDRPVHLDHFLRLHCFSVHQSSCYQPHCSTAHPLLRPLLGNRLHPIRKFLFLCPNLSFAQVCLQFFTWSCRLSSIGPLSFSVCLLTLATRCATWRYTPTMTRPQTLSASIFE